MASRLIRRWQPVRWVFLGTAVVVLIAFLLAQRQSTEVSYGQSPSSAGITDTGAAAAGLAEATVPSVVDMTARLDAEAVVRLPGSIAHWDEQRVREAIDHTGMTILVAPPGLDEAETSRVRAVENATIRVIGTQISGGLFQAVPSSLPGWQARFATGDVTGPLMSLIAKLRDAPPPPDVDPLHWRDPSDAELAAVAADLRTTGLHIAAGASLTEIPEDAAATAFPDSDAWYVALPPQPPDEPLPRYGPALTGLFPDTPIVLMYGSWIEYHGPHAEDFAELAATSFYAQFGDHLSRHDYPQRNVLAAFLNQVTDIRYAGLFDRPLPYQPFDPLRVALPALPWLFAGCVAVFLVLSVRSLPGTAIGKGRRPRREPGTHAHLAGLSALAVEMSLLTDRRSDPALTRGIGKLQAARAALQDELPDQHVRSLLADAWAELDDAARTVGLAFFRPRHYLPDWLA